MDPVTCLCSDGSTIIAAHENGYLRIFDLDLNETQIYKPKVGEITSICLRDNLLTGAGMKGGFQLPFIPQGEQDDFFQKKMCAIAPLPNG